MGYVKIGLGAVLALATLRLTLRLVDAIGGLGQASSGTTFGFVLGYGAVIILVAFLSYKLVKSGMVQIRNK